MNIPASDTIVAPATPVHERAPIAVLRVSGPQAWALIARFFKPSSAKPFRPWRLKRGDWCDPTGVIDDVLISFFKAPASYSGEDMCEISCHGNPLLRDAIEANLIDAGARRAKPGEFTQRALLNGKMGLLEAEALHDLIEAKTRYQADLIRQQAQSPLAARVRQHVHAILGIQAHIEASIDYGEEDVDVLNRDQMGQQLATMIEQLTVLKKTATFAMGMKRGFRVLLAGAPNVGKSTLFNALLARERAIVSDVPGTTRDFITEEVEIQGLPVVLIDTAGIRETQDFIEGEGIKRVRALFGEVDLVVLLLDQAHVGVEFDEQVLGPERVIRVATKQDLAPVVQGCDLAVSAKAGTGLAQLEQQIVLRLSSAVDGQSAYLINQRQEETVAEAIAMLQAAMDDFQAGHGEEILSSYLNQTRRLLGELTGETTVEDLLDRMFATFCLGK